MAGVITRVGDLDTGTEQRQCEDTGKRWPSRNQAEASEETDPAALEPQSWTFSFQISENKLLLFKPPSLEHLVMAALTTSHRHLYLFSLGSCFLGDISKTWLPQHPN